MRVIYLAHAVSGDIQRNLLKAEAWQKWIGLNFPVAIQSSWITECRIWDDAIAEQREAGMARNFAILERCDELWLCGDRVTSGMELEANHAIANEIVVRDLTGAATIDESIIERINIELAMLHANVPDPITLDSQQSHYLRATVGKWDPAGNQPSENGTANEPR